MIGTRSRTVLRAAAWVASGVIAGGLVAGVGYAHGDRVATTGAISTSAAADDLLGQVAGLGASDPTTPAPDAGKGDGRGRAQKLLRGKGFGDRFGKLGGRLLHAEVVVQTKDGAKTFLVQRGTVTSVGSGSVGVKSADGFTKTWKVDKATVFGKNPAKDSLAELKSGDLIGIVGEAGSSPTAKVLRARTPGAAGDTAKPRTTNGNSGVPLRQPQLGSTVVSG
jgi:hypothetical protein